MKIKETPDKEETFLSISESLAKDFMTTLEIAEHLGVVSENDYKLIQKPVLSLLMDEAINGKILVELTLTRDDLNIKNTEKLKVLIQSTLMEWDGKLNELGYSIDIAEVPHGAECLHVAAELALRKLPGVIDLGISGKGMHYSMKAQDAPKKTVH